jgi:hypothetical protein
VVATDCVFDIDVVGNLSAVIARLLKTKAGSYALVAAAVRNEATFQAFQDALGVCSVWLSCDTCELECNTKTGLWGHSDRKRGTITS